MRKMKKTLSLLLSLITLLSISVGAGILARAQDSAGTFTYEVLDDGTVMLTGYTGTAPDVTVPATIDGYTVYGIEGTYESVFQDNESVQTVTLESGIVYVGYSSFSHCPNLRSVMICDTVNRIVPSAFTYSPKLEKIIVDEANPIYDSRNGCGGLIETATNAFIAGGSQSVIPEGTVRIESDAFNGCTSLTEINIPNTVQTIGTFAFHKTGLTSVTIPASVTKLETSGYGGYYYPFYECLSLEAFYVDPANPHYASLDGVLFSKDMTNIYRYPQGKKDAVYVLPQTVTHVEGEGNGYSYPFYSNPYLQHIVFPENVEYIGRCAATTEVENASITILNPNCRLADSEPYGEQCFYGFETYYGFSGSSVETSGYNFVALDAPAGQGIVPDQTASTYTVGSDQPATIYCTYALADLLSVTVDYVPVSADDYTLASGSTVLQLQPDFLNTLSPGEHTVTLNYKNATASTVLTVEMQSDPGTLPEDTTVPGAPTEPPQESTTAPAQEDTSSSAQDQTTAPAGESTASAAQSDTAATAEDVPASSGTAQKSPATGAGFVLPAGVAVAAAAAALLALRCKKTF